MPSIGRSILSIELGDSCWPHEFPGREIFPCSCRLDQYTFTLEFGVIGAFEFADDDEYLLALQKMLYVARGTSTALLEYLLIFSS